jgi:hypothetical protein
MELIGATAGTAARALPLCGSAMAFTWLQLQQPRFSHREGFVAEFNGILDFFD